MTNYISVLSNGRYMLVGIRRFILPVAAEQRQRMRWSEMLRNRREDQNDDEIADLKAQVERLITDKEVLYKSCKRLMSRLADYKKNYNIMIDENVVLIDEIDRLTGDVHILQHERKQAIEKVAELVKFAESLVINTN